jgi:ComEC/Rec2-related protein
LGAPVRKIAAVVALVGAGCSLVIFGSSVPAERAFVMTAVALGAILVDRPAISMRGLAAATAIVVALRKESVVEAGFQMLFAATGALAALFEARRAQAQRLPTPGLLIATLQAIMAALGGVLLTSLVAGLATDPFVALHFQRFTVYGLAANLTVEPIVTFVIAPAAVAAALAAPLDWPRRRLASWVGSWTWCWRSVRRLQIARRRFCPCCAPRRRLWRACLWAWWDDDLARAGALAGRGRPSSDSRVDACCTAAGCPGVAGPTHCGGAQRRPVWRSSASPADGRAAQRRARVARIAHWGAMPSLDLQR